MYTTLNAIRKHHPCTDGWETLLEYLGKTQPDDEPLHLLTILESNGFNHTLWCFRAVDGFEKEKLLLGIGFAREVENLMPAKSKKCLDVFDRYANGLATEEEFDSARRAARAAAWSAPAAVAWSAVAADAAARAVAHVADAAAAYDAAWAAAQAVAAWAAEAAALSAAASAAPSHAYSTIQAKQEAQLRQLLDKTCTQP